MVVVLYGSKIMVMIIDIKQQSIYVSCNPEVDDSNRSYKQVIIFAIAIFWEYLKGEYVYLFMYEYLQSWYFVSSLYVVCLNVSQSCSTCN